jgi:ribA/ribD-fused uncharacterized protein
MSGKQQVKVQPFTGKQTNTNFVAKLNELIDHISLNTDVVTELKTTVTDLKTSLEDSQKEFRESQAKLKKFDEKLVAIETNVVGLSTRCDQLMHANSVLQDHLTNMESQSRRNNLLLDGAPELQGETDGACKAKLLDILDGTMKVPNVRKFQIVRCHRLGKFYPNATRPRPIIFKLQWFGDRESIWAQRRELKGHTYWLQEDFPDVIVKRRRILAPVVKAAREQGKRAFLSVDRLIIDDSSFTLKTVYKLPRDLQPAFLAQRVDPRKKYTAFFSSSSPMSNFHPAHFIDENGIPFHCSEQKYHHAKALEFNDKVSAQRILEAQSALECYKLGQNILGFKPNQWNNMSKDIMYKACKAKFHQNPTLMSFLRDTKDTRLIEANPRDSHWSCGLSMKDSDLFKEDAWKGLNLLGDILSKIRDE